MGLEYYIYNHANATYYELGKGPWYILGNKKLLYDTKSLADTLTEEWSYADVTPTYYRCVAHDVVRFVKGTPKTSIEVYGDGGDEHMWSLILKYKCTGSRYGLPHPTKNQEAIDSENERSNHWSYGELSRKDSDYLRESGWNFRKV